MTALHVQVGYAASLLCPITTEVNSLSFFHQQSCDCRLVVSCQLKCNTQKSRSSCSCTPTVTKPKPTAKGFLTLLCGWGLLGTSWAEWPKVDCVLNTSIFSSYPHATCHCRFCDFDNRLCLLLIAVCGIQQWIVHAILHQMTLDHAAVDIQVPDKLYACLHVCATWVTCVSFKVPWCSYWSCAD